MQAIERLLEIEGSFGKRVERIVPLELDGETLRLILYLKMEPISGSLNNGKGASSNDTVIIGYRQPIN